MNLKKYNYNFNFFNWIKKTELVELNSINTEDDPIRPELSNEFRTSQGRKIFGLKYKYLKTETETNSLFRLK